MDSAYLRCGSRLADAESPSGHTLGRRVKYQGDRNSVNWVRPTKGWQRISSDEILCSVMSLDDQLGPFVGKYHYELDPSGVHSTQQIHYERWMAKEFGHFLLFHDANGMPGWMKRHVRRLSEPAGVPRDRAVDRLRLLYRSVIDLRLHDLRRDRDHSPLEDYLSRHSRCYQLARQILSALDDPLQFAPENVTWGHVSDMEYAKQNLENTVRLLRVRNRYQ